MKSMQYACPFIQIHFETVYCHAMQARGKKNNNSDIEREMKD